MKNIRSLHPLFVILSCFAVSLCITGCRQEAQTPPNVLLIVTDDQGYADMGCTGLTDDVETPNLDQLAASGVRFSQAYATSPICNPSRAGIITGCYQQRWGTFWYGGKGIHNSTYTTIPEILREKNYITGYVGKVHYGGEDFDTMSRSFPLNHGFEEFFGFTSARKHYLIHQSAAEASFMKVKSDNNKWGQSLRKGSIWDGTQQIDTLAFSTEMLANRACEFIRKHKNEQFFLQVAFNAVHNFTHQLPKSYLQSHGLNGYHDWDPATEEYYDWYVQGRKPNNPEGRAHYLGQLFYLDREIGKIMQLLEEIKLRENTLIIYISDNGGSTPIYANNTPLRGGKYTLYEGGIRVPFIISWPLKFKKDGVCENVVSAMDIFSTICKSARIQVPDHIDGIDLTPLLTGNDRSITHDTLIWDTGIETAVRMGKWKYRMAGSREHADYEMTELELGEFLYDLEEDPGETKNLANEYPDTLALLKMIHQDWKKMLEHQ